ncbi:imidazole glycerol phosphate synthase subunit HisH [Flammeovirga kamogawensis]|uniref:Imidazole glycerol phosphate synthase subunit HisH n=1 Tax=Flammeovirga kamogawensis TaxID=373891 RepID=A0ABX8GZG5_9BACT|nr:imidazole glycerol phosphate synthase subunit HisH [Flammeovirga kamogawensis]MBB6459003.1 glutamine amidotransferase [Flammeovirga kamogawensis]QWG08577.1 imidazole glycerol phosphate synthase subunit HisH [Flammeovirga kamogawensis]TRX66869.1 imidazole glycerol phosphate synthase subunit HisH [Flammeovirga kamogawensis]
MKVAIIKYNAGNVQSVRYALQRLGIDPILTDNAEELMSADKVIFPGVGEAKSAMDYLKERNLDTLIKDLKQPTLGVCLGLQLMCNHSEERDTDCLGIFDTKVKKFESKTLKVPHMGWNNIHDLKTPLYKGIEDHDYVYYVHSYYAELCENTIAITDYVNPYSASLHKDNFYAAQFHPEKSGDIGQKIIQNFLTNI